MTVRLWADVPADERLTRRHLEDYAAEREAVYADNPRLADLWRVDYGPEWIASWLRRTTVRFGRCAAVATHPFDDRALYACPGHVLRGRTLCAEHDAALLSPDDPHQQGIYALRPQLRNTLHRAGYWQDAQVRAAADAELRTVTGLARIGFTQVRARLPYQWTPPGPSPAHGVVPCPVCHGSGVIACVPID